MKRKYFASFVGLLSPFLLYSQSTISPLKYNTEKDKVLYTIGYAHLDTQWNWDYPQTINEFIKNIMTENFHLFEKYPDYVFNFTGSRRYQMMKEYYPDLYKNVIKYVKEGRWKVSGSSVDEGEVNISSSESLIRQVLYGNLFFKKEFGIESKDYMLPDCFGFLANTPSIWNYCGLLGFSTQKLTWHSAVGIPFNVGVWNGPDGKGIVAALNPAGYTAGIHPRFDRDSVWDARLSSNMAKYGFSFDFTYYGVGDQGGAPRERDVKNAEASLNNSDSKFKVMLTSSDQMFKDITPEIRKKLPVYSGDLLLIEHSAGSLTSEAYMKRMNRKNEMLAQSAEEMASMANWLGVSYPQDKLNNAWNLVLGSQFHDILPGTAIPRAYEFSWNDEFIAANGFSEVLKNSVRAISTLLNTQTEGRSLIVSNPVASNREDIVTAELIYAKLPENIQVKDKDGKILPSQIIGRNENKLKFIFEAKVPSVGASVFEVREVPLNKKVLSSLSATDRSLENEFYKVKIGDNGDVISLFDKKEKKELLAKPASLEFLYEHPKDYPAWNMDWNDRQNPAIDHLDKNASISVAENGPVRVSLCIKREGRNSTITQYVSLSSGEAGKRVEFTNKIDWQSTEVSLKAAFPLTVNNENATYCLGVGNIMRGNNSPVKYEVPSKEWFDLTDKSGSYGVSILEDCKYGSDKPDNNTLRLTLLYTPKADAAHNFFGHQGSQDWGIHDFRYAIYGHSGDWSKGQSAIAGHCFNQPLLAFESPKHDGPFGKSTSFLSLSSPQIGLMAIKKMEQGDYFIVRVNELSGKDLKKETLTFKGKIEDAFEVNGQEQKIASSDFSGNRLNFDLSHYTIKSFAVKLASPATVIKIEQENVELPYNQDVMSFDDNRDDGVFSEWSNIPAELIPDEIESEGIRFKMGSRTDGNNNAVMCKGQKITIPKGYDHLYFLAAANDESVGEFKLDTLTVPLTIQKWNGFVGQFYNRRFAPNGITVTKIEEPFSKQDNIAWFASHRHIAYSSRNDAYHYCYLFKYEIKLPKGTKILQLPDNNKIKILSVTVSKGLSDEVKALGSLSDDFSANPLFVLREKK